jgi:vacuolar protein sorting-associated protein 13A/C
MNLVQQGNEPLKFVSSAEDESPADKDLLSVIYKRVDKASPEFATVYEGINQSIDIRLSTFIFRTAPKPVLNLYNFVMTTFVPPPTAPAVQNLDSRLSEVTKEPPKTATGGAGKIRVFVKLASVQGEWLLIPLSDKCLILDQVMLINEQTTIATLSLSTADVAILLQSNAMRITARLGSLALSDDSEAVVVLPEFKQMMSIEGDNFAEFRYQTFDPQEETYTGIKSAVYLNAGSIKFQFLDRPLHDIYLFMVKLAKLKGLYDAATQVAVQKASELERVQFDVSVKSPILVFPSDAASSRDVLVLRLGEIKAQNAFEATTNKTTASLHGIQLASTIFNQGTPLTLKIIDDIDISADIVQTSGVDRTQENSLPETQVQYKSALATN